MIPIAYQSPTGGVYGASRVRRCENRGQPRRTDPGAPGSRRGRTRRRPAPSTTRWSNVTETLPTGRTTISSSTTTAPLGDAVEAEDRDLGVVDERRHQQPAEPAGARHRERRPAQLVRRQRSRARTRRPASGARRSSSCRRALVASPDDRDDEAVVGRDRRCRCRRGRGARSRRPRSARSARDGRESASAVAPRSPREHVRRRRSPVKSHSSTNVTAGTSRWARVTRSAIARRTPRIGIRV